MQLHLQMRKTYGYPDEDSSSTYNGIIMVNEVDLNRRFKAFAKYRVMLDDRMQAYEDFVARGGKLADKDYANWKWTIDRE